MKFENHLFNSSWWLRNNSSDFQSYFSLYHKLSCLIGIRGSNFFPFKFLHRIYIIWIFYVLKVVGVVVFIQLLFSKYNLFEILLFFQKYIIFYFIINIVFLNRVRKEGRLRRYYYEARWTGEESGFLVLSRRKNPNNLHN